MSNQLFGGEDERELNKSFNEGRKQGAKAVLDFILSKQPKDLVVETEGEIRALKHILSFVNLNLKASKIRLKEYKQKAKEGV